MSTKSSAATWSACVVALLTVAGCSDGETGHKVTGVVSYEGKPLNRGIVNFVSDGQRPQGGAIAADGTYDCRLPEGDYSGTVTVGLELPEGYKEGQPIPPQQLKLPDRYANPRTSGISLRVSGPTEFDIDLE